MLEFCCIDKMFAKAMCAPFITDGDVLLKSTDADANNNKGISKSFHFDYISFPSVAAI